MEYKANYISESKFSFAFSLWILEGRPRICPRNSLENVEKLDRGLSSSLPSATKSPLYLQFTLITLIDL